MSDIIGISSGAISAYQRALSTTSNNIANVNTDGYSRQVTVLQDSAPKKSASMYLGTGVLINTIRRQYDAFAESNLRNSTSDLSAQTPMVDYASRVVDIMGNQTSGLSSALDTFFSAADALSADPASSTQRTSFLNSAGGVASRFGEVSSQLSQVTAESMQGMQSAADQVNVLTAQLAQINQSMTRSPTLEGQPAQLLDARDKALRDLSNLVKINVTYNANGMANVSVGTTNTRGILVNGIASRQLNVDLSQGKVEFVIDKYGNKTETVPDLSGGTLGGYQTFIVQVLTPAVEQLDALTQTFVNETNAIQQNGLDGYGETGMALFAIDPNADQKASGVRVALTDGMRVATAAQFRVSDGATNVTTTKASVRYTGSTPATKLSNSNIVNNPDASAGVTFKVEGGKAYTPVTQVAAGVSSVFYLDGADPGQQLQVLTKDGQQLIGKTLTETQKYQLLNTDNGFEPSINYSDRYLNKTENYSYRGLDYFYGAKAGVLIKPNYDPFGNITSNSMLPATMTSARLDNLSAIAANGVTVNGVQLGAFVPTGKTGVTIAGLKGADNGGAEDFSQFTFTIKLGNKTLSVPSSTFANVHSVADMRSALENALQILDVNLSVNLANGDKDLVIEDGAKRAISLAQFDTSDADLSNGASTGNVSLNTDATRMADWFNGQTQVTIDGINFGTQAGNPALPGRIRQFSMTLANIDYKIAMPTVGAPNDVDSLAAYLQTQLRTLDQSTHLSVEAKNGQLKLTDDLGRKLQSLTLTPSDDSVGSNMGQQTVVQSHVSSSNARATLFSQINVPASKLDFSKALSINGVGVNGYYQNVGGQTNWVAGYKNTNELIQAINQSGAGVTAALGISGDLQITNKLGAPITIDTTVNGNALNVEPGTYQPQMKTAQITRDLTVSSSHLDFSQALTINGFKVMPGVASYTLPASDEITQPSVTWTNQARSAGITIANVSMGGANNFGGFSFAVQVDDPLNPAATKNLTVSSSALSACKNLAEVAVTLQRNLQLQDNSNHINVSLINGGQDLQITDDAGRVFSQAEFKLSGASSSANAGTVLNQTEALVKRLNADSTFNATFVASVNADGVSLDLKTLAAGMTGTVTVDGVDIAVTSAATTVTIDPTQATNASWQYTVTPDAAKQTAQGMVDALNADAAFAGQYVAILSTSGKLLIQSNNSLLSDANLAANFNIKMDGVQSLTFDAPVTTRDKLIQRIKDLSSETGVTASVDTNGDIVLSTTDINGTQPITIGPNKSADGSYTNALDFEPKTYDLSARIALDQQAHPEHKDLRIGFGAEGQPTDLATMGLRTAAYFENGCPDDLLVFVTGKGTASVAASFSGEPTNKQQSLRAQSFSVKFIAADRYNVIDNATGTVLADRTLDMTNPTPVIEFQGLQLQLSSQPSIGDSYVIDGNKDGLGNNVSMLEMANLAKKKVSDGKTLSELYINQVNNVGNLGQQAKINQTALQTVKDQAEASRDKVAGVNLDDEAADLIRYQQAYQAAAKALQVATQLFDSIKQIG